MLCRRANRLPRARAWSCSRISHGLPDPKDQGLYRVSSEKAFAAGWHIRPFEETAFDCLSDFYSGRSQRPNYLTDAREKEVLEAWKHRAS